MTSGKGTGQTKKTQALISKMEKLNQEDNTLLHISHRHLLHLTDAGGDTAPQRCNACRSVCAAGSSVYQCAPCRYVLHRSCAELGRTVRHPSHPEHALYLQLMPRNEHGCHLCNACRRISYSLSLHCEPCKFSLHLPCAALPEAATAPAHPHPLKLTYEDPRRGLGSFDFCMICRKGFSTARWFYACKECGLSGHVGCVVPDMPMKDEYAALDKEQTAVADAARWTEASLPESEQQLEELLNEQSMEYVRVMLGGMLPLFAKACQE